MSNKWTDEDIHEALDLGMLCGAYAMLEFIENEKEENGTVYAVGLEAIKRGLAEEIEKQSGMPAEDFSTKMSKTFEAVREQHKEDR